VCTFETSLDDSPFVRLGANATGSGPVPSQDSPLLDTVVLAGPAAVTSSHTTWFSVAVVALNGSEVHLAGNVSVVARLGLGSADLVACAGNATTAATTCGPLGITDVVCPVPGLVGVCNFTVTSRDGGVHVVDLAARNDGWLLDPTPAVVAWLVDDVPPVVTLLQGPSVTQAVPTATHDFVFEVGGALYMGGGEGAREAHGPWGKD
jgi:hypothetical protein